MSGATQKKEIEHVGRSMACHYSPPILVGLAKRSIPDRLHMLRIEMHQHLLEVELVDQVASDWAA